MPVTEVSFGSPGEDVHAAGARLAKSPHRRIVLSIAAVALATQLGIPIWWLAVFCAACIVCTALLGYRVIRRQLRPAGMWQMITACFALMSAAGILTLSGRVGGPLNRASDLRQVMVNSDVAMYAAKKAAKSGATSAAERAAAADSGLSPIRTEMSHDHQDRLHTARPTAS